MGQAVVQTGSKLKNLYYEYQQANGLKIIQENYVQARLNRLKLFRGQVKRVSSGIKKEK